jgi:hypothetical protein
VDAASPLEEKVSFFAALFGARTDVYAVRWENARTGRAGWMPAVAGGWRKGTPPSAQTYLPLTSEVLFEHLSGRLHIGLCPLLEGDRCRWLAADFDGSAAVLDALAHLKAARQLGIGLVREAIGLRWRMDLASYDRLFPSQDVLPSSGIGTSSPHPCRAGAVLTVRPSSSIWPRWNLMTTSGPTSPPSTGSPHAS